MKKSFFILAVAVALTASFAFAGMPSKSELESVRPGEIGTFDFKDGEFHKCSVGEDVLKNKSKKSEATKECVKEAKKKKHNKHNRK